VNAAGAARCRGVRRAAVAVAALTLGGCTLLTDSFLTNEFSGDKFPVHVDASRGALLVGMRPGAPADNVDRVAVLDLLSPFTLIDPRVATAPSLQYADVLLLGKSSTGELTTPRARFPEVQLLSLHADRIKGRRRGVEDWFLDRDAPGVMVRHNDEGPTSAMRRHGGQDLLHLPSDVGLPGERDRQMDREKVIVDKEDACPGHNNV